ncbi:MAG: PfkB family carbohydrate kinase [Candidatus Izemoplasmataceae bacterium]
MQLKKNALYDIVAPTSMGVRITPIDRQPVHLATNYIMQATSAESNVLSCSAALGLKTKVLSAFVKDSPIAQFIKNDLSSRHIEFDTNDKEQGGPWGYRHQFNIADSGYGLRAPRVQNDRTGEVGQTLSIDDFDIKQLLEKDGVKIIHISGLIAALSESTSTFCIELAKQAKQHGTLVSFDINYREFLWKNRQEELQQVFHQITSITDILIGNEEDFQLALGIEGPQSGGQNLETQIEHFKTMISTMKATYPNIKIYANTLREVKNANEHLWGTIVNHKDAWHVVKPRPIQVLDRIGGGDGFVGGFLYGIVTGKTIEESTHFGWASGAYTVTLLNDFSTPLTEEQIWSVWEGNARVRR